MDTNFFRIRDRRFVAAVLLAAACLIVSASSWFLLTACANDGCFSNTRDELTEKYRAGIEPALNKYFDVIQNVDTFQNPEQYCPKVTVGNELVRCISLHINNRPSGDTNLVQRLRVLEYQEDCAVVVAVYTAAGSTQSQAYLLLKKDDAWKVADRVGISGEYSRTDIALSCAK